MKYGTLFSSLTSLFREILKKIIWIANFVSKLKLVLISAFYEGLYEVSGYVGLPRIYKLSKLFIVTLCFSRAGPLLLVRSAGKR